MFCKGDNDTCLVSLEKKKQMGILLDKRRGSPEADLQAQRVLQFEAGVGEGGLLLTDGARADCRGGPQRSPENECSPRCPSETDEGTSEDDSSNLRREHPSEGP